MYELRKVGEKTWYIESPAKIGVVELGDNIVVMIDSGSDKEAGRKVRQILDGRGWTLKAIYNTHSNADHIGGNRYLQNATGCRIIAPDIEAAFIRHPVLEPAFLYGGFPFAELRHKFLMAQASEVESLTPDNTPDALVPIDLPGHFFGMTGFQTLDGVTFLADCLARPETLEKYRIPFIYDVKAYLETLERVKTLSGALFIPAHADPTTDPAPLAQMNIDATRAIAETIETFLETPMTFETLLQALFNTFGLTMTAEQYVLVGSTVRSFLSWLHAEGRAGFDFVANEMRWQRKQPAKSA